MADTSGASAEKLQKLMHLIECYLDDGKLSEQEEQAIFVAGQAAGIPDAEIAKLISTVGRAHGLSKKEAMLPSLRLWVQSFLKGDGVIDKKERIVLEGIAEKIGMSIKELDILIADEKKKLQKSHIKWWKLIPVLLLVLGLIPWLPFWKSDTAPESPETIMKRIPIASLAVYDFRFVVLTDAKRTETGDLFIRVVSAGMLGNDEKTKILYQAGVDIKYGVDLQTLTPDRYSFSNDRIILKLPRPTVIGKARLINTGEDASRQIAAIPENTDTTDLQKEVAEKIQQDVPNWPEKFGLTELTEDRIKKVLSNFIQAAIPGKKVDIQFEEALTDALNVSSDAK